MSLEKNIAQRKLALDATGYAFQLMAGAGYLMFCTGDESGTLIMGKLTKIIEQYIFGLPLDEKEYIIKQTRPIEEIKKDLNEIMADAKAELLKNNMPKIS